MSATHKAKALPRARATKARAELGDLTTALAEVAGLKGQPLIDRYTEVMGQAPKSKNQGHLRKRIAIELQCKASGHPTSAEKARIKEVQAYALEKGLWPDLRKGETGSKKATVTAAASVTQAAPSPAPAADGRDPRLPPVGTVLTKQHGNETHRVTVLAEGFEYRGETHRSLSKVARLITGTTWNGFLYFGRALRKPRVAHKSSNQHPRPNWLTTGDQKESPPHEMSKCGRGSQQSPEEPIR